MALLNPDCYKSICYMFVICASLYISDVRGRGGPRGELSNEWLLQSSMDAKDVAKFAQEIGFEVVYNVSARALVLK